MPITRAAVTAALVLLAGLSPLPAHADPAPEPAAKVDVTVAAGESTTYFVQLKAKADLSGAQARDLHRDKATAAYQALTSTAELSQRGLRKLLDEARVPYEPFWIANTVKVTGDAALAQKIAELPEVEKIVPERSTELPEPKPGSQLQAAAAIEWNIQKVKADQTWSDFGVRGEGIVIGEIDSGVQYDHPALVAAYRGNLGNGQFSHDYNWFDPAKICQGAGPCDNNGHGTHVMGTMVGADGLGVAPGAKWIAAKGCESGSCSDSSLLKAGQWMLAPTDANGLNPRPDLAPHVVNNSWGGSSGGNTWYQSIIDAWVAAGIFPAFAAGNDGNGITCSTTHSPGDNTAAYGVGASDANDKIASFSGFGPSRFGGETKPNITAPGVNIRSSMPGGKYQALNGTSMATPHVTAVVALVWSAAPSLVGDITGTRALLDSTASDVDDTRCGGTSAKNNIWGEGLLNAHAAVDKAPRGDTGDLSGKVTDAATGKPLAGVTIAAEGPNPRTAVSNADGTYKVQLVSGAYTLTASGYGYSAATATVEIGRRTGTVQDFALQPLATQVLSGTVLDLTGKPLPGASVLVKGTPLAPVTTDGRGAFSFPTVATGEYELQVSPAAPVLCNGTLTQKIAVGTGLTLRLPARADAVGGYSCAPADYAWLKGRTEVPLTGDEDALTITPPFPVTVYGQPYEKLHLTTNGVINLLQPRLGDYDNTAVPSAEQPNGAIYAYWDDLVTDEVYTEVHGDKFVVEWRDATVYGTRERVTFEVVFDKAGGFTLQYREVGKGASATVGVENVGGGVALQYSFNEAALRERTAIRFTPGAAVPQEQPAATGLTDAQIAELDKRLSIGPAPQGQEPKESKDAQAQNQGVTIERQQLFETAQGMAAVAELPGTRGGQLVVHSTGMITALDRKGDQLWRRTNGSFYDVWQLKPVRPWDTVIRPLEVPMGFSVIGPYSGSSERGYAVGDLTGDGKPEVAVALNVGRNRPVVLPGVPYNSGTYVVVLDSASGATLWQQLFVDAKHVLIHDGTLIVSDQSGVNRQTPAGYTSTLYGYRFTAQNGALTTATTWTIASGSRPTYWNTLEPAGTGQVAAVWTDRTAGVSHTLLVNIADGAKKWDTASTGGFPRTIRLDAAKGVLVGLEQNDLRKEVRYDVVTFALADGAKKVVESRINALPLHLRVAGPGRYAVNEATIDPYFWVNSSTVRLVGSWSHTIKRAPDYHKDGPMFFGLQSAGERVLASSHTMEKRGSADNRSLMRQTALTALEVRDGDVDWERRGVVGSPIHATVIDEEVLTVTAEQNLVRYSLRSGRDTGKTPLMADLSSAATTDLTGDGTKDLIAGGQSHAVYAFDGKALNGEPKVLWRTVTPGAIHKIELADVDGDGRQEVVVAATTQTLVLDARTGHVEERIEGDGFVWTFATAELDGRRGAEIVVPTTSVRAYTGSGHRLWSYSVKDVNFGSLSIDGGRVYASYNTPGTYLADKPVIGGVALDGRRGKVLWQVTQDPALFQAAQPWNGVFASRGQVIFVWLKREDWTPNLVELRDGATGKVLTSTVNGGLWTNWGWKRTDLGLLQARAVSTTLIDAAGGVHDRLYLPPVFDADLAKADSGTQALVTTSGGGFYAYDPAVLTAGNNYPDYWARVDDLATVTMVKSDLDGDGNDELVGLPRDVYGFDKALELSGGGYYFPDEEMHGIAIYNLK
ncbi:S8 family serine peptidase [Nonomuraea sp. NPDC059194]|uniref:S8 family serine peptidase n=1 Tax=Nonomuraea sp. NPDC059194 TaxID=3346764 RepID=UPI003673BAF3